ncbi:MAG: tetratricopeptide repeat protein [Oscillospiraceae bacterium]|nr:tetratricopeptide repeat protein [Oscillospiraceae bacterium]
MFCGKCGKRLVDGNIFCTGCGAMIVKEETAATPAPVKAVAVAAPVAASAEAAPAPVEETPPEPELSPEEIEQTKKNMKIHAGVFGAVALLLLISLLVFNPTRVRYEVQLDGYGRAMTNFFGQEMTVTQAAAGPWGLFTQPVPYVREPAVPVPPTMPGGEEYTTVPPQGDVPPPVAGPEVQIGIAQFQAGQFAQAVQNFNTALAVDPENFGALAHRGMARFQLGYFHSAINDLTAAHRQSPDNGQVLVWRGASFYRIGFYAEAVSDLTRSLELERDNITALEFRGRAHEAMGNHAAAAADNASADAIRATAMQ